PLPHRLDERGERRWSRYHGDLRGEGREDAAGPDRALSFQAGPRRRHRLRRRGHGRSGRAVRPVGRAPRHPGEIMRKPRSFLVLVVAAFAAFAHPTTAKGQAMRTPDSKGYAEVNGVELYYEVHGDGPPL